MEKELTNFFEEIKPANQIFLFRKLYNNPKSVLGNEQELFLVEKEYTKLPNYYDLILNNNLLIFLDKMLKDEHYCQKLDMQCYQKLIFFLLDSIDFKKIYKYQKELLAFLNNEISVKEFLKKINLDSSYILDIMELCKKNEKLLRHNYSKEQIDNFDNEVALELKKELDLKIDTLYETTIKKDADREYALQRVEEDDYDDDLDNVYLYTEGYYDPFNDVGNELNTIVSFKSIELLVCENRFVNIMEQLIDHQELEEIVLENAMSIISGGIIIKSRQTPNALYFQKKIGNRLVQEFDLEKARRVYRKMEKCKTKIENKKEPLEFGDCMQIINSGVSGCWKPRFKHEEDEKVFVVIEKQKQKKYKK